MQRAHRGRELGGKRDYLLPAVFGKSHQELKIICDSATCYLGHVIKGLWERLVSVQSS